MDYWRYYNMRERLYDNALNGTTYYLGRPIPFCPKMAARLNSTDPEIRREAWSEAETKYGRRRP